MDYHKMALAYMASSQYKTDTDPTSVKSHCFVPDTKYDTLKSDEKNTTSKRNHRWTKNLAVCMCDWR